MPRALVLLEYRSACGAVALILTIASALNRSTSSSAFTNFYPHRCSTTVRIKSSRNNEKNDVFLFDDFGDGDTFGGNSLSDKNTMSSLLSRMSEVKSTEAAYDAKLARNWRRGNWSVRGFALDKSSSTSSSSSSTSSLDKSDTPVHVSVVAAPTSSYFLDSSLLHDSFASEERTVAVGRTDGSVFIIQLGEEYLTTFVAVPKHVDGQDAGGNQDSPGMDVSTGKIWMNSEQFEERLNDERNRDADSYGEISQKQSPFTIKHQFLASEYGEAINKLVFIDSIEGNNDFDGIICAASGDSGEISIWKLHTTDRGRTAQHEQSTILKGVHHDEIISLQPLILHPSKKNTEVQNVLFSACRDGTFALWNIDNNGELMISCQCSDLAGDSRKLTCADVFNPSSWDDSVSDHSQVGNDVIFLGTSNGYVIGYRVLDLLANTNDKSTCPSPNLCYRAHGKESGKGESVTAVKCGGDGTIVTSARLRVTDESQDGSKEQNSKPSSLILLTGGEDGSVKQWEILSQKTPSSIRMEHWPRLSTQRMKRRAHVFSPSHDGPVTCIAQNRYDASKFITSGKDGSVCVWSASSGKELFRMEGFSSVSSLACLGRELLVTDGMNEYVCVHDFGIAEDAASNGYELEW